MIEHFWIDFLKYSMYFYYIYLHFILFILRILNKALILIVTVYFVKYLIDSNKC
jgi:hypothetical protein